MNGGDRDGQRFRVPGQAELRARLSAAQYKVTQESATEPPFANEYWNEAREGIYVDIASGQPLFSSRDKFDSDCGWPSFSRPIAPGIVSEREDRSHGMLRVEARSALADSHLGHLFDDGPGESAFERGTGMRYCINSAALRFIPRERMEAEGYGDFLRLLD